MTFFLVILEFSILILCPRIFALIDIFSEFEFINVLVGFLLLKTKKEFYGPRASATELKNIRIYF
jgi:hypothetical protein